MQTTFQNLVNLLSKLPGIGQRSATRISFFLLKNDATFSKDLGEAIINFKDLLFFCETCGALTDKKICNICLDPSRISEELCVVEEPGDVIVIEQTKAF